MSSQYRGFNKNLISRATRAEGDCYYLSSGALRGFNAYGGAWLDSSEDHVTMVDSIRNDYDGWAREYRVTRLTFWRDEGDREHVRRDSMTDNYDSAAKAVRAYRA